MSWQNKFTDNTTSIAFNLRLTKAQVAAMKLAYLYHIGKETYEASKDVRSLMGIDQTVPALKALQAKGLIEHHPVRNTENKNHSWYTLTPAGMLVYDMLYLAGLVQARKELRATA